MRPKLLIIEDTESMNSAPRVIVDSIIEAWKSNQDDSGDSNIVLFWNSPCYLLNNANDLAKALSQQRSYPIRYC